MGRSAVIIKSNPYGLVLNLDPELRISSGGLQDFLRMRRWRLPSGAESLQKSRSSSFWKKLYRILGFM